MDKYINPYHKTTVIRNKVLTERKICGFNSEEMNFEIKCVFLLLLIMSYRYALLMHVVFVHKLKLQSNGGLSVMPR